MKRTVNSKRKVATSSKSTTRKQKTSMTLKATDNAQNAKKSYAAKTANRTPTHTTKRSIKGQTFNTFHDVFVEEIQDLLSSENQFLELLPQFTREATSHDLKQVLREHFKETQSQVERLKEIFHFLGEKKSPHFCRGMEGILKEGKEALPHAKANTKDALIIAYLQKIKHYEIAAYGTAKAHARSLAFNKVADLLTQSLDEESTADKKLSKIAEGSFFSTGVNSLAIAEELKRKRASTVNRELK